MEGPSNMENEPFKQQRLKMM